MGELLPYYALFYVLGLLLMALFVRLYWSRKKYNDAEKLFKKKILSSACNHIADRPSKLRLEAKGKTATNNPSGNYDRYNPWRF